MKRATLPYNFHICISTAAGSLLTPQITVPLQSCYNSKLLLGQWGQGEVYVPAEPSGTSMDLMLSSSAAGLQTSPPSHGVRRSRAYPRLTARPAQGGRAGMQCGTPVGALCAAEEGCLSHTSCLAGSGSHSLSMGEV